MLVCATHAVCAKWCVPAQRYSLGIAHGIASVAYAINACIQLRCEADFKRKHQRNEGFLVGGTNSGL